MRLLDQDQGFKKGGDAKRFIQQIFLGKIREFSYWKILSVNASVPMINIIIHRVPKRMWVFSNGYQSKTVWYEQMIKISKQKKRNKAFSMPFNRLQ